MGGIDIVMTICLLANPQACEKRSIPIAEAGSMIQCMAFAQPRIAEWSVTHPKYRIVSWRCAAAGAEGQPI